MVGWLYRREDRPFFLRPEPRQVLGLPLAAVGVTSTERGLRRGAKALAGLGVRRVLAWPEFHRWDLLAQYGLSPVDPLPLCRALGARLALELLTPVPLRGRCAALRGDRADGTAQVLAETLCPRVGTLLLDFDKGEEGLSARLRERFGAAPLRLGQGPPPAVSVELAPRPSPAGVTVKLWGTPGLAGLALAPPAGIPAELAVRPLLELLWETGRLAPEEVEIFPEYPTLDRAGGNNI